MRFSSGPCRGRRVRYAERRIMPLVFYRPNKVPCRLCGDGFERRESASDTRLTHCHKCGQAVTPVLPDSVSSPQSTRKPSIREAKAAGFTVLKKISSGEYEKQ